jgi:hypothetical protein
MIKKTVLLSMLALLSAGCIAHAGTSGQISFQSGNVTANVRFGDRDRETIRQYYEGQAREHDKHGKKPKKTPPGLAKREQLPPGLARQDRLPPGLQGRGLPADLERRLPPLPKDHVRVVVGSDVVIMHVQTRVVLDILRGVVIEF